MNFFVYKFVSASIIFLVLCIFKRVRILFSVKGNNKFDIKKFVNAYFIFVIMYIAVNYLLCLFN